MNNNQLQILTEANKTVTYIFKNKVNSLFVFHNLDHTQYVVNAAEEIEKYYKLNDNDQFVLSISAWFHDIGFASGQPEEHEKESIKQAVGFLNHRYVDQDVILRISSCIRATHMPQEPLNQVEEIMCDADLYHLGTNTFSKMNRFLRHELQNYFRIEFSDEEWCKSNIDFLKSHKYFTGYCHQKLEPVKQQWIGQMDKIKY